MDNIRIFLQERNRGKGAAVRRGFAEAVGDVWHVQRKKLPADGHQVGSPAPVLIPNAIPLLSVLASSRR